MNIRKIALTTSRNPLHLFQLCFIAILVLLIAPDNKAIAKEASEQVQVELISKGSEPRKQLRYQFEPGHKETILMETRMSMSTESQGKKSPAQQVPTTRMTMSFKINDVSAEGNTSSEFLMEKVEVLPSPDIPEKIIEGTQLALDSIVGLKGHSVMTPTGHVLSTKMIMPDNINPQLKQTFDNLSDSMEKMAAPFPEEAVGIGASWKVQTAVNNGGLALEQIATYTITDIQDDVTKFDISLSQSAPKQDMTPQADEDAKVILESLSSNGGGKIEIYPGKMAPVSSVAMEMNMSISVKGQKVSNLMMMEIDIKPSE